MFLTETKVINGHMALFLDIGTIRPDGANDKSKYNIKSLTEKDWRKWGA